jgi:hypothetical protein
MKALLTGLAFALIATSAPAQSPPAPGERTIVNDRAALARLQRNSGITLQWISFESPARGHVVARMNGGLRIDARSFTFRGRIVITDAPDRDRNCVRDGTYEFRVTGQRRYWRLQEMTVCDGLTDYVDIYF